MPTFGAFSNQFGQKILEKGENWPNFWSSAASQLSMKKDSVHLVHRVML